MSELWLCREKTAQEPFWIAEAGIHIHTIEELCYYLFENLYLLGEELMDEQLFNWMRSELAMPRLAALLSEGRRRKQNVVWCAVTILREAGCYEAAELSEMEKLCREMGSKSEFECGKVRADRLLANGRFASCIRQYFRLLDKEEPQGSYPILQGNIWHNLGTAYARLFLFEEASECFERAYDNNQNPVSNKACLDARECLEQSESESAGEENTKEEARELPSAAEMPEYLKKLKEDYKKKVMEYGTV